MAETSALATRGVQFRSSQNPSFNMLGGNYTTNGADPAIGSMSPQAAGMRCAKMTAGYGCEAAA